MYEKLLSTEPVAWTLKDTKWFQDLKAQLTKAPVLSLPNLRKPFDLFVNEGIAYRVITQDWGKQEASGLSVKIIGSSCKRVASLYSSCGSHSYLIRRHSKAFIQWEDSSTHIHDLRIVLSWKAPQWLTDSWILRYEITLMNIENLEIVTSKCLNPTQFLTREPMGNLEHNCRANWDRNKSKRRPRGRPLTIWKGPIYRWIHSNCSGKKGIRICHYWSRGNQRKRKITLKLVCMKLWDICSKERFRFISRQYRDNLHGFSICLRDSSYLWKNLAREEMPYSNGKSLAHEGLIREVLESLRGPKEITIVHIKGHQKGNILKSKETN